MSENAVRHMIAFLGTLVTFLAWLSGFVSAARGWWWTAFGLVVIYVSLYQLLEA